jgi:hypothetical protein
MRSSGCPDLRRVPAEAAPNRTAAVRAMRRANRLAGRALPRMRRSPTVLRACARGGRVRRGDPPGRRRLERARPPRSRGVGGGDRRRNVPATRRSLHRAGSSGPRPVAEARSSRCDRARTRARGPLGAAARALAGADTTIHSAARVGRRCPSAQCPRSLPRAPRAADRAPRRRRLHDGRDRQCSRLSVAKGGRPPRRSRDVRPHHSPPLTASTLLYSSSAVWS